MRIPLAMFADYALAHEADGRLYVVGGGIRSLAFPTFPAIQPHLALALGIEVPPEHLGKPHSLSIEASGPTTETVFKPVRVTFTVPPQSDPRAPGYIHFVSNMDNVAFPVEGEYAFAIAIDDQQIERVHVKADRGGTVTDEVEVNSLLMEGYRAFNRRQPDAAEAIFREVVKRFPEVAGGHNNLGFVLLSKGDAQGALTGFTRASELGYGQGEIIVANVASALYLLGETQKALDFFRRCLGMVFRTGATLFVINGERLSPIQLASADDYVALIKLNAAWCAVRLGDAASIEHYLDAVRTSELAGSGTRAEQFQTSLRALETRVK